MMIKLNINNKTVEVKEGSTLMDAAIIAGEAIPSMCHNGGLEHFTSCMICLVKNAKTKELLPSCTAKAYDGMEISTTDPEVRESRKIALELLMSEHAGDCEAPCRVSCPAFMDIPQMNRLIAESEYLKALKVVMNDIAMPGVLGRICPAPCEGACKRKPIDGAVSICLLKRFVADENHEYPLPEKKMPTNHKVAIIGAGPAGLSAAFYLQNKGIHTDLFDRNPLPGGALQYSIPELDKDVLKKEINYIFAQGAMFHPDYTIGKTEFEKLRSEFDAVVIATGDYSIAMDDWGLENNGKQIAVEKGIYLTNLDRVFAIGNVNRPVRLAIRSAAQGKEVAVAISQLLAGEKVTGEERRFNSTMGKLLHEEFGEYLKEGSSENRQVPSGGKTSGFEKQLAQKEAARCLHCDCRKPDKCKLRILAQEYDISKKRFTYTGRKPVKKHFHLNTIVFEPGKCIKCGICVRLTAKHQVRPGFTFIGRGFDVEIGIPFNQELETALENTALLVAEACPTGALCRVRET